MMNKLLYLFLGLGPILWYSCSTPAKLNSTNLSEMYTWSLNALEPEYFVYHNQDSVSWLYFKLKTNELSYRATDVNKPAMARVKINYILYDSFETEQIKDSLTYFLVENTSFGSNNEITGKIGVSAKTGNQYLLRVVTTDVYSNHSHEKFMEIDKRDMLSRQNFMFTDARDVPVFSTYLNEQQEMNITYRDRKCEKLFVRYYNRQFDLALPPFSSYLPEFFSYGADSVYSIAMNNGKGKVQIPSKGFLHIQSDTLTKSGISIFKFPGEFPNLGDPEYMAEPLRYITSRKEYEEIINSDDIKLALDKFWLSNATNPARSKELIKHFYNRVAYANKWFTSYDEGWRTDRGMAYVVFGPPNVVYKNTNSESWIYGEENNYMSVNFVFEKVSNPFTANDYRLNRSSIYKSHWYRAVDSWRQGRVFLSN